MSGLLLGCNDVEKSRPNRYETIWPASYRKNMLQTTYSLWLLMVETKGIEPSTPRLRTWCSPS